MTRPNETTLAKFFASSISGSILLIIATILAMICANSELSRIYESLCNQEISIIIGGFDLLSSPEGSMTLARFVNDALMAIFFFAVGLEIKREMLIGELSQMKHAMLPIIAALGGMIVPVLIFYFIANGTPAEGGIGIPMATDIAFSLGVLSLLGKRVPLGLKVFLTTLAVADDIGGIMVIAIFYSSHIAYQYLLISVVVMVLLYIGARRGVNNSGFYAVMGIVMWFLFFHSGIHPTIAGVIVAFFVPARPKIDSYQFLAKLKSSVNRFPPITQMHKGVVVLSHEQLHVLHRLNHVSNRVISPLQKVEDLLHPVVTFFIIPVFAFVNAGVVLDGISVSTITGATTMGVFCGLLFGKFIGIFTFSYLAIKTKFVCIPSGVNFKQIAAVSVIGGIGFTVSLFIADLSYANLPEIGKTLLNEAKLGIISASLLAGVIGYFLLRYELRKTEDRNDLQPDEIESNN